MSFSFVSGIESKFGDAGWTINGGTSGNIDTSGASLLFMTASSFGVGTLGSNVTDFGDSKSNTWHKLTQIQIDFGGGNTFQVQIAYAWNPTVGSGHNFTYNRGNGNLTTYSAAFAGSSLEDTFDAESGNTAGVPTTSIQPGSITPAKNNELFICVAWPASPDGIGVAIDSGFTLLDHVQGNGSTYQSFGIAYKIKTNASAENPTWSWSTGGPGNGAGAATMAAFKLSNLPNGGGQGKGKGHKGGGGVSFIQVGGTGYYNIGNPGFDGESN